MKAASQKGSPLSCLFTAVEADPFVKVGGLGDVAYALPHALRNLHPDEIGQRQIDVRLAIPCHSSVCDAVDHVLDKLTFTVNTHMGEINTLVYVTEINGLPIYIISSPLIPQDTLVYSNDNYIDGLKFLFFSQATLALLDHLNWKPDILHVNDWHTAITPYLLKRQISNGAATHTRSVLTIHNLPFLGTETETAFKDLGIPPSRDKNLPSWARKLPLPIGLANSDSIVAVSPTYAAEILTSEFGCGLEEYLGTRQDALSGIINGIDTHLWNPASDAEIFVNYSIKTLHARPNNKHTLQNEFHLNLEPGVPLLAFIGRMQKQKGVDLILEGLHLCKDLPWQAILLGKGDPLFEKNAIQLQSEFPGRVQSIIQYDSKLSRRIYAGADVLLMPSRYEPCGLAQMIAMRYGCLPLARATGGLKDTITGYHEDSAHATGFLFEEETPQALANTIQQALEVYKDQDQWHAMQVNAMRKDFSWHQSALKYAKLYMGQ